MRTSGIWKDAAVAGHHLARDLDGDRGTKGLGTGLVMITYFGMKPRFFDGAQNGRFVRVWRIGDLGCVFGSDVDLEIYDMTCFLSAFVERESVCRIIRPTPSSLSGQFGHGSCMCIHYVHSL
jgi:hypothetical protein